VRAVGDNGNITARSFSLRRDLDTLGKVLTERPNCALVIVDPISAYLDGTDSHINADVRALLAPLGDLAARHKVAVVCVAHLNKGGGGGNAMYRVTGSLAFVAAARSVLAVTKDQDDAVRRLVLPMKNNLGADTLGLAYRIKPVNGAPVVEWEPDPVSISAEEALTSNEGAGHTEREAATDWLRGVLADGPLSASEIKKHATEAGITWATVRRAQTDLGIKPTKTRFDGGWKWALPSKMLTSREDAQPKSMSTLGAVEHLGKPESGETGQ
jgi:hypothetical protein